jgi:ATF/CREB family transcription factor
VDGASLSKNALLARENRLKKKRYINGLEENLAVAKKENEALVNKLKEKDDSIDKLQKEIIYFKSILANVQEISGLIKTIKQESSIPMSTSLSSPTYPVKRSAAEVPNTLVSKKLKMERISESSSVTSNIFEEDDCYDWMPSSPTCSTQLDAESLDVLSNFSEEDINLFGEDSLIPTERPSEPLKAGVCLHVFNKKVSLEFCATCANRAQEKWSSQI